MSVEWYRHHVQGAVNARTAGLPACLRPSAALATRGGKCFRGSIVLDVARSLAGLQGTHRLPRHALAAATCLELVHCASLILDDLPDFDNDIERRGAPSVHASYGTRQALMTVVALFSDAVAVAVATPRALRAVMHAVVEAAQGQLLEGELVVPHEDVMRWKTGALYEAAFMCGYVANRTRRLNVPFLARLRKAGAAFGVMFQVADDAGDVATDAVPQNMFLLRGQQRTLEVYAVARATFWREVDAAGIHSSFLERLQAQLDARAGFHPAVPDGAWLTHQE
jgi:geranylgeranyl pyrophosphate synthase